MNDALGARMKIYEAAEAGRRLMPQLPAIARIDGRAFHSFTKGLERPFDPILGAAMVDTTIALVRETGATMGFTQSDEITLAWLAPTPQAKIWFDGRVAKMTSQLGALATLTFYRLMVLALPAYAERLPTFDARVWNVPNRDEGANVFLWREWDATKNSLSMAASTYYSEPQLDGKDGRAKRGMLERVGVNWEAYPMGFKRGTFVQRRTVARPFTMPERATLPPRHAAHADPGLMVERTLIAPLEMPAFVSVVNRAEVIFDGAAPIAPAAEWKKELQCG